jgi:restriction system protein
MKGWIFGSESSRVWTQSLFKKKYKFQNPLYQNYRHIKALEEVLGKDNTYFHSVVVFIGESTFKTSMPSNVFNGLKYLKYIKSFHKVLFYEVELHNIIKSIQESQMNRSYKTNKEHIQNLKKVHG